MATTVQQVPAQDGQLRRLEPAAQVAARAGQLGEQAVQELCRRAPESLKPSLEAAVQRASPIVAKATDSGEAWACETGPGPRSVGRHPPVTSSARRGHRSQGVVVVSRHLAKAVCVATCLHLTVHKRSSKRKLADAPPFRTGILAPQPPRVCPASTHPSGRHLAQGPRC